MISKSKTPRRYRARSGKQYWIDQTGWTPVSTDPGMHLCWGITSALVSALGIAMSHSWFPFILIGPVYAVVDHYLPSWAQWILRTIVWLPFWACVIRGVLAA